MIYIGDIFGCKFVDQDQRWYRIDKVTRKTVFAMRLKVAYTSHVDKFGCPLALPGGKTVYGSPKRFRRRNNYIQSHVDGPLVKWNGNFEMWSNDLCKVRERCE